MVDCVFCRIAIGKTKIPIIFDDHLVSVFPDICPIRPGHIQIIPRKHFPCFEDVPGATINRIVEIGQQLSRAMKTAYNVQRVAFLFSGGDVAHAHAHVVPMHEKTDITSRRYIVEEKLTFPCTPKASDDELAATARRFGRVLHGQR